MKKVVPLATILLSLPGLPATAQTLVYPNSTETALDSSAVRVESSASDTQDDNKLIREFVRRISYLYSGNIYDVHVEIEKFREKYPERADEVVPVSLSGALAYSLAEDEYDKAKYLLSMGADPNTKITPELLPAAASPIHMARQAGGVAAILYIFADRRSKVDVSTFRALRAAGADVNVLDAHGRTLLHHAVLSSLTGATHTHRRFAEIVDFLLEAGTNPYVRDEYNYYAIEYLSFFENESDNIVLIKFINNSYDFSRLTPEKRLMRFLKKAGFDRLAAQVRALGGDESIEPEIY